MAARRLIIFMLALLVLSSVAAALVPIDSRRLNETSTTTTAPVASVPAGELVRATVDAEDSGTEAIEMALGDRLELSVRAASPGLVEVEGLGQTDDVDPNAPATFDLRPFRAGDYPVRVLGTRRAVARIEVARRS
jgi:hypothetical protein